VVEKKHTTFDEYVKDLPEQTQRALRELRDCILKAAPAAIEMFNYNIPAFALVEGGKRDQQIMVAGYKNHVGLYPGPMVIEYFASELKGYKQGKGSVQFPVKDPLPKTLIMKMVRYRMKLLGL
jgi:uncharacterized protein YdhG (YjbR/CyaY superfamily)